MTKRIGILSGMGAVAGAWLLTQLIEECQVQGATKDSDFPEIVLFSMASGGMDETGIANETIIIRDLYQGIHLLNRVSVDIIIIACNSVYKYYPLLQNQSKAPIINMPQCTQLSCHEKTGIVSSRTTKEAGLYKGIQTTQGEQRIIDGLIADVISGKNKSQSPILSLIIDKLRERGAQQIIIGCTELSPIAPSESYIIDAGVIAIREALS